MKKIILITTTVLFAVITANVYAQEPKPYKPLSAFGTDTIAFLRYNFKERADQYAGKTIAEILNDAQLPPKSFTPISSMYVGKEGGIIIYFDNSTKYERLQRVNKYSYDYIYIYIYFTINSTPLYQFMKSYDNDYWVIEHYNFFKHVKADRVSSR